MSSPSLPGYENLELIGKGGFSRVYKADQAKLKRKVAVKVLNFGLNDQADRVSFARETELMGRVSTHPNIVTVHDTAFSGQGQPCIVMELYPGGSLADLINEVGRLNTREALEVGVAIASALEASHLAGVLHCDLKPQNILISEFGQPALGDFGISTFAEERTRTGRDAGAGFTLPYAAPEIVEGESPMIQSDVYSLAATLYTSLCGRRPFAYPTNQGGKPTAAEQARRILLEPVPTLTQAGVPPALDELIRRAMSKDPAERPVSAAEFAMGCHQIGQALGLGTSSPRIADQGALRIVDSEAVGHGQVDLSQLVRQRHLDELQPGAQPPAERESGGFLPNEASIDATPSGAGFDPAPRQVSDSRRRLAAVGGVVAVLAVIALLFFATRGGEEPVADGPPIATSNSVAIDPIVAPTRPTNVVLERTNTHALSVSWQVPEADLEAGDVTYEVRRQDGTSDEMVTTMTNELALPAIANDEGVCVTVLAVRGNRTSQATEAECSTPIAVDITVEPNQCAAPCDVTLSIDSASPTADHTVSIIDRSLADMKDAGWQYDAIAQPAADDWRFTVDDTMPAGEYLVVVTFPDETAQTVLFQVIPS